MLTDVLLTQGFGTNTAQAGLLEDRTPGHVVIGNILALVFGLLGALLAAYVMWFFRITSLYARHPNDATVGFEAVCGFFLLAAITWVASGACSYYVQLLWSKFPSAAHAWNVGFTNFDVYVTVHRAKNVTAPDGCEGLFRTQGDLYMEVQSGRLLPSGFFSQARNPAKRTCVSKNGVFEETFHFVITPTDDNFRFMLYDQNLVVDGMVGLVDVPIADGVLNEGFPQKKAYKLHAKMKQGPDVDIWDPSVVAGTVVVSFIPGDNFPNMAALKSQNPLAFDHLQTLQTKRKGAFDSATKYGTWDHA